MRFRLLVIVALALSLSAARLHGEAKMDEPTRKATARALKWLADRQNPDGSWTDGPLPHNTAITSFALLAFMSQGHLPNQGTYGPEVAKAARFLVASIQPNGGLVGARGPGGRNHYMYCHGMATLALAELWGSTGDDEIKPVLQRAVDLIVASQKKTKEEAKGRMDPDDGGWRYEPAPTGADVSVTIMQVMALRAAKNAGLLVPDETLQRAIAYIKRCYVPDAGGFNYQPGSRGPAFARTAAGLCVLFLTSKDKITSVPIGKDKSIELPRVVRFLNATFSRGGQHFWYGHYYAAHAMHQVGRDDPKVWDEWYARLQKTLLPLQSPDGSWQRPHEVGPVYSTSIAVIVLSVPAHYLPIFQR
jgi:hypothetical protein